MTGKILHLHQKPKTPGEFGLRKPSAKIGRITAEGLEGDYNDHRTTKKNGHRDMALLVMPVATIDELRSEGWPVEAGDMGENIVTEGIPYSTLQPEVKFKLESAVIQISYECDPCYKLHSLPYVGEGRGPEFVNTMMGRRGWYARVIETGEVTVGSTCELIE